MPHSLALRSSLYLFAALGLILALLLGTIPGIASPLLAPGNIQDERLTRVIVEMEEPALAARPEDRLKGQLPRRAGARKMDLESLEAREYLSNLDVDHTRFSEALLYAVPNAKIDRRFRLTLNGFAMRVPASKIDNLKRMPGVKRVSPSRTFRPVLDASVPLVNAPALWSRLGGASQAGLGVKVAVLDTGIDQTHPFLTDSTLPPPSNYPPAGGIGDPSFVTNKVIVAKLYAPPGTTPSQGATLTISNWHGTHVAGIAGGVYGIVSGVAPKAYLMNYKVLLGPSGEGETPEVIQAIEDAVADGVDVVNMSLGGSPDPVADEPLHTAIRNGTQAGVVFAIAAGNSGSSPGNILSPGTSPEAITVGASDDGDNLTYFSSRGPNLDLSIKPDVTAPGYYIYSSWAGGTFGSISGTSMAAPHVAGAAALLKQLNPTWTSAQIKSALVNTAKTPVYDDFPAEATVMERGSGRIDLQQAMEPGLTIDPPSISFGEVNVAPDGLSLPKNFTVKNVSDITGTWTISVTQAITTTGLQVYASPSSIDVPPNTTASFTVVFSGTASVSSGDYEGHIRLQRGSKVLRVPYFARTVSFPYVNRFPLVTKLGTLPANP